MKTIQYLFLLLICLSYQACNQCDEVILEPCGGSSDRPMVDLIVIMDHSQSMADDAQAVSDASEAAIQEAAGLCDTDLEVTYLGVDGAEFADATLFATTHRQYLYALHGTSLPLAADTLSPVGQLAEQGADAVADLSVNFDWRENACRAILYISDEPLDGNTSPTVTDAAIANAIARANENGVTVFTIFFPMAVFNTPLHIAEYQNLSENANGEAYINAGVGGADGVFNGEIYIELLPKAVCQACNACKLNRFVE
ncbi:MAG: hypothetical protein KDC43_24960 [Saprospiraceae bacterium]|nr:hypothetical protein [Saprospiraceae bacterium]MCB0627073.1 hypothetical protein [Saprospiraceae bacterium]MCB0676105.1 hypothetical protein [Saprospiraceae bacterium]